jgi:hypothetical protein
MLFYALAGAGVLVALMLLARGFVAADPRALAAGLRWAAAGAAALLVAYLALTGRLGVVLALAAAALPVLLRHRHALLRAKAAAGPTPGRRSSVRTRHLEMDLDHDTGAMDGRVAEGPLAGRRLADLGMDDLLSLRALCRDDERSLAVLDGWLDRERPGWREAEAGAHAEAHAGAEAGTGRGRGAAGNESPGRAPRGGMSREEAHAILGLEPGASPERIREAHRRLMIRNHPDRGGSSYLAARINQAKDVLLAD